MKRVETYRWYLPPKPWAGPRARPYLSSWRMDAEQAAKHGAIRPEPSSLVVLAVPESEDEHRQRRLDVDTSAGQSTGMRKPAT